MVRTDKIIRVDMSGLTTTDMLEVIMEHFNKSEGVTFLCHAGQGKAVIQRLRMRLSRLRNSMDAKNLPKQHFRLETHSYPYTNLHGKRYDCIVMTRVKSQQHLVSESVERFLKNAQLRGNDGGQSQQSQPTRPSFEW